MLGARNEASQAGFLGGVAAAEVMPAVLAQAGDVLGAWALERLLGEGGMGTVWLARRVDGRFEGQAAIKLLRTGLFDRSAQERFKREGGILARLHHPGIAALLDAGVSERGQPFLVLEYVQGQRIDRYCDAAELGVRQRVELFLQVLDAVAAAHAQLIIHRDLKPSNILVDEDGRVRLLDFGLAKLQEDSERQDLTRGWALTPEYAAPEQFSGGPLSLATDVFALGVVLFELLTGKRPHGLASGSSVLDHLHSIQAGPFKSASQVAPSLAKFLRGDLDNILAQATQAEPQRRYVTVQAFCSDLQAFLDDRPVGARPLPWQERCLKFARRNRAEVVVGSLAVLALVAGVIGTTWMAWQAEENAQRADQQSVQTQQQYQRAQQSVALADVQRGLALQAAIEANLQRAMAEKQRELASFESKRSVRLAEQAQAAALSEAAQRQRADTQAKLAEKQRDSALAELSHAQAASELVSYLLSGGSDQALTRSELLDRAEAMVDKSFASDAEMRARMFALLSIERGELMQPKQGQSILLRARTAALEAGKPQLIASVDCKLAHTHTLKGEHEAALRLMNSALKTLQSESDADVGAQVNCLNLRALLLLDTAQPEAAIADARAVLSLLGTPRQDQRMSAIQAQSSLANGLRQQGKIAAAVQQFREVIASLAQMGRNDTVRASAVWNNLGGALLAGGQVREAVKALQRSLELKRLNSGSDDASAVSLANLGSAYAREENWEAALEHLLLARKAAEKQQSSGVTAEVELRLGGAYLDAGKLDEAAAALAKARPLLVKSRKAGHPSLAALDLAEGKLNLALKRPERALSLMTNALTVFDAASGDHPGRLRVRLELARLYQDLGQKADAVEMARQALIQARHFSAGFETSDHIGSALLLQAELLAQAGQGVAAAELAAQSLQHLRASVASESPMLSRALALVGPLN
ncbi:serine/threonine-protein kinase [Paucibacter sp. KBW04]|uniref:serine/threonine-protein kinase n=1 Tax=Paucibacter sp. KBW04 TaxID=2153361 RepID=UPI0018CC5784|nr:serine/threonine-protein kinase [Paucibacter sp. KBW04]